MVEVYTQTKPAVSRRAAIAAAGLLILTALLAWWMTRTRADDPVRMRIEPAGWSISFEAPFRRSRQSATELGYAFSFLQPLSENAVVVISVHRIDSRHGEALAEVAHRVALSSVEFRGFLPIGPFYWFDKRLGPFQAVQIWEPGLRVVVRAARAEFGDETYAVSVFGDPQLGPDLYDVFESVCDSVQRR